LSKIQSKNAEQKLVNSQGKEIVDAATAEGSRFRKAFTFIVGLIVVQGLSIDAEKTFDMVTIFALLK